LFIHQHMNSFWPMKRLQNCVKD